MATDQQKKYPNSGKLSISRYKETEKQPDLVGELVMTRQALKGLLEETDEDDIVIKLSGWSMNGQYGPWTRLAWNNYKKPTDGNVAKPQQQALPADDDSDSVPF